VRRRQVTAEQLDEPVDVAVEDRQPLVRVPLRESVGAVALGDRAAVRGPSTIAEGFPAANRVRKGTGSALPYICPTPRRVRKTSVYLDEARAARLARLAQPEGRSQADVLRSAVDDYRPHLTAGRDFALAAGFARIDDDPRPVSQIPEDELLSGFGE